MDRDDVMMNDPMADETASTPAELVDDVRAFVGCLMARLRACEASVAAVQARQESHDAEIRRVRRDLDALRAESAVEF